MGSVLAAISIAIGLAFGGYAIICAFGFVGEIVDYSIENKSRWTIFILIGMVVLFVLATKS